MSIVRLKVLSILFIVCLTVFCYSCHSSRPEIGLSPQWSSNPLTHLHNFPQQSLYCQPDLSQLLRKKISVAPRNPIQCHCGPAAPPWPQGDTGLMVLQVGPGALRAAGVCWDQRNGVIPVHVPLWLWWDFSGSAFGFFSVWSLQPLHFFHMLSSTVCPTESCRAQFGLFVTKRVSSPPCLHIMSTMRRARPCFFHP